MVMVVFATCRTQVQEARELLTTLPANEMQMTATRPAFIPVRFVLGTAFATLYVPGVAVSSNCGGLVIPVIIRQGCIQSPFWKRAPGRNYPFPR